MRFLAYFCTVLLITFVFSFDADAADFTNVANGANTNITAHSVCRNVANATGATIFVPHKTSAEWSSVYNNPPSGVTINSCAVNGSCGSATSGAAVTAQPTTNLCSAGTFTELSDTSSWWRWRCDGTGGGSNSGTCQRARTSGGSGIWVQISISGEDFCTPADTCPGTNPAGNSCSPIGTTCDYVTGSPCLYSVRTFQCQSSAVNGSCGSAASGAAVSSQPTTNLCSAGTFVELSDTSSWWQWRCNGTGGGSNSGTCQRARTSGGSGNCPLPGNFFPYCVAGAGPTITSTCCTGLADLRQYDYTCGGQSCISFVNDASCAGAFGSC